jgi:hypothetical protein
MRTSSRSRCRILGPGTPACLHTSCGSGVGSSQRPFEALMKMIPSGGSPSATSSSPPLSSNCVGVSTSPLIQASATRICAPTLLPGQLGRANTPNARGGRTPFGCAGRRDVEPRTRMPTIPLVPRRSMPMTAVPIAPKQRSGFWTNSPLRPGIEASRARCCRGDEARVTCLRCRDSSR